MSGIHQCRRWGVRPSQGCGLVVKYVLGGKFSVPCQWIGRPERRLVIGPVIAVASENRVVLVQGVIYTPSRNLCVCGYRGDELIIWRAGICSSDIRIWIKSHELGSHRIDASWLDDVVHDATRLPVGHSLQLIGSRECAEVARLHCRGRYRRIDTLRLAAQQALIGSEEK